MFKKINFIIKIFVCDIYIKTYKESQFESLLLCLIPKSMSSQTNILADFQIRTHHIKSLNPPFGQNFFMSAEPSMLMLERSLCQQKNQNQRLASKEQNSLMNSDKGILNNLAFLDLQNTIIVSQQDISKLLTQLILKGKRTQSLLRSFTSSPSITILKQQYQKYSHQNIYLKSTCQIMLNEYFKKRKLGPKLRGLNADLLNEIQNKMFSLIQVQIKLWFTKEENQKIQRQFTDKAKKIKNHLIETQKIYSGSSLYQ